MIEADFEADSCFVGDGLSARIAGDLLLGGGVYDLGGGVPGSLGSVRVGVGFAFWRCVEVGAID